MKFAAIEKKLAGTLSPKRFLHSQGVSQTAAQLAVKFGADRDKAALAGILHDCARAFSNTELLRLAEEIALPLKKIDKLCPVLLHAPVGAYVAQEAFQISDEEILQAISFHTLGGKGMGVLDKIIYLADFIEPGRACPNAASLRDFAFSEGASLDEAMLRAYDSSIYYTLGKRELVHTATIKGRNELLLKLAES
ncbi:MAG: bis(5'-nucleosyl)-tetraphosphatase (symmetrical) YqeK [Sporomusaceae bacterium]|jgi:predicted HD superfamily hydrolase involved in NAD metabolism|nr:bis(5'-nucleosyl)-tetraphosphatase (symmetrical) YqeK [Sporomusaceae bacterium]